MNVLVLYESRRGYTLTVSRALRDDLRSRGHLATAAPLRGVDEGTVSAADALIVGTWTAGKIVAGVGPAREALEGVAELPSLEGLTAAVFCTFDVAPRSTLSLLADALVAMGATVDTGETFRGGLGSRKLKSLRKVPGFVDAALASFARSMVAPTP